MNKSHTNRIFLTIITVLFGAIISSQASAKSLYVIANINASPTPIHTYDIQPAPNHLVFQAEQGIPFRGGGGVGIALDADSAKLFITYEVSNVIQLLDAITFADLGTTTAPGASNLAGIVVHQAKNRVYTVDRFTNNLYVYDWDASTDTLTQVDGGGDNGNGEFDLAAGTSAFGVALDETRDRLYVADGNSTTVRYYETTNFTETDSVTLLHNSIDVAVDQTRNFLYSTGAFRGSDTLYKFNLNNNTASFAIIDNITPTNSEGGVGVAVDEATGNVYVTTGFSDDWLLVMDSDLNLLTSFTKAEIQAFGDGTNWGDPTGIVIPRAEIGFNPLGLSKTDDVDPVSGGSDVTYTVCYDNSANTSDATNVTITDTIPALTSFVAASGSPTVTSTEVVWDIGTVLAGAAQACETVTFNVTAAPDSVITNTVTIASDETGPSSQTETTDVSGEVLKEVRFRGEGEGGKGSTGPLELLFGLLCLPLLLARRTGRRVNYLVMAGLLGALVTVTATSSVMAADNGWFAGAGIGSANTDVKSAEYDTKLAALGYTASSSMDDTDLGWKLFGGYEFTKNWAIEGAYVDLGKVTSDTVVSSGPAGWTPQDFVDAAATVHPYSVDGFTVSGIGTWPFGNGFSVFAKLGFFVWEADILVECVGCVPAVQAPDGEDGTDVTGGLGVGYDLANNFGVRVEWERFTTDRDDVDLFSASVLYRF